MRFAVSLADDLEAAGVHVAGLYLHGSAALGGWHPARSDVDLLIVVEDRTTQDVVDAAVAIVLQHALACPGTGIECSIVDRSAATRIRDAWPYLAHIDSGDTRVLDARPATASDPDLLMHYAVCREAGIALTGPPALEMFAPVPRPVVLGYLTDELGWGLAHAPAAYALLNACRARVYLETGEIVSKIEGGDRLLDRSDVPTAAIADALAWQRGGHMGVTLSDATVAFIHHVANGLRAAQ